MKNLYILSSLILFFFTQCGTTNSKVNDELLTYLNNNQYFKLSTILKVFCNIPLWQLATVILARHDLTIGSG